MIILHGLLGSLDNWRFISKELGNHFKVFALDQRNHGRSPHSSRFDYMAMAEDLHEFMSERCMESAVVLGHSMGGKTAMQFALSYPREVESLIVVDILPGKYRNENQEFIHLLRKLITLGEPSTLKEADGMMSPLIQDAAVRNLLLKNLVRNEKGGLEWRINLRAVVENLGKMSEEVYGEPFRKPCLFVQGGLSDHMPGDRWVEAEALFPSATLLTIPDAGHWVHADRPGEILNGVLAFLNP